MHCLPSRRKAVDIGDDHVDLFVRHREFRHLIVRRCDATRNGLPQRKERIQAAQAAKRRRVAIRASALRADSVATAAICLGQSPPLPDASIAFTRYGLPTSQPPQRIPCANQGRIEKEGLPQVANGVISLTPGLLEIAAVFVGQGINRIDSYGGAVVRRGHPSCGVRDRDC
jgi:hypothetical protein